LSKFATAENGKAAMDANAAALHRMKLGDLESKEATKAAEIVRRTQVDVFFVIARIPTIKQEYYIRAHDSAPRAIP